MPWHRNFEEVNLRFYLRRAVEGEVRRGVAFIKEIVPRWAIAQTARVCYNEPYVALPMGHEVTGPAADGSAVRAQGSGVQGSGRAAIKQAWHRWLSLAAWRPVELDSRSTTRASDCRWCHGSHEEFIAEHYWGYCRPSAAAGRSNTRSSIRRGRSGRRRRRSIDANVAEPSMGRNFARCSCSRQPVPFLADGSAVAVMRVRRDSALIKPRPGSAWLSAEVAPQLAERLGRAAGGTRSAISKLAVRCGQRLHRGRQSAARPAASAASKFVRSLANFSRAALLAAPGFQCVERVTDQPRPGHARTRRR